MLEDLPPFLTVEQTVKVRPGSLDETIDYVLARVRRVEST